MTSGVEEGEKKGRDGGGGEKGRGAFIRRCWLAARAINQSSRGERFTRTQSNSLSAPRPARQLEVAAREFEAGPFRQVRLRRGPAGQRALTRLGNGNPFPATPLVWPPPFSPASHTAALDEEAREQRSGAARRLRGLGDGRPRACWRACHSLR